MKKTINICVMILMMFILISCVKKPNDYLAQAIKEFNANNYELSAKVLVYDEIESNVNIKVDGDKSYYKEDDFIEEYYVRDGLNVTTFKKVGDNFVKLDSREKIDEKYLLFQKLSEEWFDKQDDYYSLKIENYQDVLNILNTTKEIEMVSFILQLQGNKLKRIEIEFSANRDKFFLELIVVNEGNVSITLPEVKS